MQEVERIPSMFWQRDQTDGFEASWQAKVVSQGNTLVSKVNNIYIYNCFSGRLKKTKMAIKYILLFDVLRAFAL